MTAVIKHGWLSAGFLWSCTRTFLYIHGFTSVFRLEFHSECLMSTLDVFALRLLPTIVFELPISLHSCVGFPSPELFSLLSSVAPDKAPTILSVTPHTTTSVLVRWQVRCWISWRCVFWAEDLYIYIFAVWMLIVCIICTYSLFSLHLRII